jgi:hypothetical protein
MALNVGLLTHVFGPSMITDSCSSETMDGTVSLATYPLCVFRTAFVFLEPRGNLVGFFSRII